MKQKTNEWWRLVILFLLLLGITSCHTHQEHGNDELEDDMSWAMVPFTKVDSVNPVLVPGTSVFLCPVLGRPVNWEEKDVFNPAAVVRNNKIYLLYRAEDTLGDYNGTSRIGLAESDDGLHFKKMSDPVLYPDNDSLKVIEWEGGTEDPRVVESEDGNYVMTYTAYDGTTARLLVATSSDLIHWNKHGIALQGKYRNTWSKSGAIVARRENSHVIATKVGGKYWMYFGDTDLFIATSTDLIHWVPLEHEGKLLSVLTPRPGYFDSRLVESGPFALQSDRGIVLIYNGMNLETGGDPTLAPGAYCAGQALFDKDDPTRLVGRLENNFLMPERPYETTGQINQVCFIEGLVPFHGMWLMYYGTADSKIAVAVKPM
jgi:predicted GH43/DUF377 family glycosyl hydrolase